MHFLKLMIFNNLKTKYFYYSQLKSKKTNILNLEKGLSLPNLCLNCHEKLKEDKDNKEFLRVSNNKINNDLCVNCNSSKNSITDFNDELNINNLCIENRVIIYYEKNVITIKIKNIFKNILKSINEKQKVFVRKSFNKWNYSNKYSKYCSNIKNEYEKKYAAKFEAKIQDNNKIIKKLDKEKIEISIKNDSLQQSIEVNTLKMNTFKDKEKNLNVKLKTLTNEKKKVLSDLHKNEADIDNRITNSENILKDLENKIKKLKDSKSIKDQVLNKYVDDMNEVLDFYEKKTSKI